MSDPELPLAPSARTPDHLQVIVSLERFIKGNSEPVFNGHSNPDVVRPLQRTRPPIRP
jgi:hypothetical protein